MFCIHKLVILFLVSVVYVSIYAHPVTWKEGWVVSSKITHSIQEFKTHYSLTNKWAVGFHGVALDDSIYGMAQSNFLLQRWNGEGSQGNMYLFLGLGSELQKEMNALAHLGGQVDWETRSIYTQCSIDSYLKTESTHRISSRIGFSPYLGEYNDLHTWLIVQMDTVVQDDDASSTILPMVRFFKDNFLLELGSNFSNRYLFTAMVHF